NSPVRSPFCRPPRFTSSFSARRRRTPPTALASIAPGRDATLNGMGSASQLLTMPSHGQTREGAIGCNEGGGRSMPTRQARLAPRTHLRHQPTQLKEIAVGDPCEIEGLTQFPFPSRTRGSKGFERQDISDRICVKGCLRYIFPDRPQRVDSKAERCRSGRSSTLGSVAHYSSGRLVARAADNVGCEPPI